MTGVLKAKVSGSWVPIIGSGMSTEVARWNSAWGVVAQGLVDGIVELTTSPATLATVSFTSVYGRQYRVMYAPRTAQADAGTSVVYYLYGIPGDTGFNDHYQKTSSPGQGYGGGAAMEWRFVGTGSALTLSAAAAVFTGTGRIHQQAGSAARLYVEDTGPVSVTASPPTQPAGVWQNITWNSGGMTTAAGCVTPRFRIQGDSIEFDGVAHYASGGNPIGTMPIGCRPQANQAFPSTHYRDSDAQLFPLTIIFTPSGDIDIYGIFGLGWFPMNGKYTIS